MSSWAAAGISATASTAITKTNNSLRSMLNLHTILLRKSVFSRAALISRAASNTRKYKEFTVQI
jgi:hypothetical protein